MYQRPGPDRPDNRTPFSGEEKEMGREVADMMKGMMKGMGLGFAGLVVLYLILLALVCAVILGMLALFGVI